MFPIPSFLLFITPFLPSCAFPIQVNNITDSLPNELSVIIKKNKITEIGFEVPSTANLTTRDIDQYVPSAFFIPNPNVDLGIDRQNLLSVITDEEKLSSDYFNVHYLYRSNVFPLNATIEKNKTISERKMALVCNYTFYSPIFHFENQTNPIHYDIVLQYQRFIFGVKSGVLYNIISYNESDFKTKIFRKNSISLANGTYIYGDKSYNDKILQIEAIIKIFLSSHTDTYMIVFVTNKIYIFNLLDLQYQIGIQYQAVLMEVTSESFSTSAISSVNDAHISGNKLFIASYGIDFYSFDNGGLTFLFNIEQQNVKFTIISFVVVDETIFAIAKNRGLVTYKKSMNDVEYHMSILYEHSFMQKLFFM